MKTTVEPQEGNNVKLLVEVEEAEFERALDTAFKKIAREVHIPGFRPGKVPRRILEKRIGADYARGQALQDSLPEFYVQALVENDVDAISSPELKLVSGEESGPVSFEAVVEVRPTVRVPGYDGLQVTVPNPQATDEEIEAQVERMRGAFATLAIVDRQAHEGDNVTIDVAGTIDGDAVPGLTASDYLYEVGAGSVVPELDTNLVGASAGETLTFEAPIPGVDEEGAVIQFNVTVKAVNEKVLPDADDEWAASASEFSTVAELRADIAKRMTLVKRVQANMAMRDETVKALVELVDEEVPEALVNTEINRRLQDLANRLAQQNATIEMYLQATNQTEQMLIEEARPGAIESVKADLALRAVAEAEAIEVADSDIDDEIANLASRFKMKPKKVRTNLEKSFQMPVLKADIRKAKALTWLTEHATVVDADGHVIERSLLEVNPEEFAEAGESADVLGLDSDLDVHDHDHDHDHEGHDHD
jgi:trigger factor